MQRRKRARVGPFTAPEDAAAAASLRHVTDSIPGISRKRAGKSFSYRAADGSIVRDRDALARIRSLAIPPAWTDVWISPLEQGHIQATGRDARGRKQYRYHPRWTQVRDATKYGRMLIFGRTLPRIRSQAEADIAKSGMPREKVLATVVRLLESTHIRVGNEEYARSNKSFGLTTMLDRHVAVSGSELRFRFRGKSGKTHAIALHDRRLARIVQQCRDLPGQDLFQYIDDDGAPQPITSADVNQYLRDAAGQEFTAKDFRTWAGTLLAARALIPSRCHDDKVSTKSALVAAITSVAEQLGNTVAVCRKCYIHPAVLDAYQDPTRYDMWAAEMQRKRAIQGLDADEAALLRFLKAAECPLPRPSCPSAQMVCS